MDYEVITLNLNALLINWHIKESYSVFFYHIDFKYLFNPLWEKAPLLPEQIVGIMSASTGIG